MFLRVGFSELRAISNAYHNNIQAAQDLVRRLRQEVEQLVTVWQGQSGSQYEYKQEEWYAADVKLRVAAEEVAKAVEQTLRNFEEAESDNVNRLARASMY